MRPDNATLLVVGDLNEAALRPMLERRFGGWRAPATPLPQAQPFVVPATRARPQIFLLDQPGAEQSTISIAGVAPPRADPDYDAMGLASGVLGGGFLGRLNMNLREGRHWSYGAFSSYGAQLEMGRFGVTTSVQTDQTAPALSEIDREVRGILASGRPTPAELRRVKDTRILALTDELGSSSGLASYYATGIRLGLDTAYWNSRAAQLEAVIAPQLNAAAARLIKPDQLVWVIVGDLSRIEADVRKLGIADVRVIDNDRNVLR